MIAAKRVLPAAVGVRVRDVFTDVGELSRYEHVGTLVRGAGVHSVAQLWEENAPIAGDGMGERGGGGVGDRAREFKN